MNERFVIDADATDLDLAELGINHKEPNQEDIYELLWGVPRGQPIPAQELGTATVGERLDG